MQRAFHESEALFIVGPMSNNYFEENKNHEKHMYLFIAEKSNNQISTTSLYFQCNGFHSSSVVVIN